MAEDKKSNDKNFKALVEEQKRTNIALNKLAGIEEEQKKGTTALNKLAGITEEQGPPPPPDNSDIVGGLEELGEKITGGTKELSESDKERAAQKEKNQRGYKINKENELVMQKKDIDDRKQAQSDFQEAIEAQGGDVKLNYEFQREQTEITKAEFALRKQQADTPGARKELKKEEKEALKDAVTGPLQRGFKGLMGGISTLTDVMGLKAVGSTFKSFLKFGLMGAALLAVTTFLKSETWAKWKKDLIPNLEKALIVAGDILSFIFTSISNSFKAIKALFGGFVNEKGEIDIIGGFKQMFENIDCIGPAILGLGAGFLALSLLIPGVSALLLPTLIFKGLFKAGKWLIAKPFIAAFKGLGRLLGLGGGATAFGPQKASFWQKTVQTTKGLFSKVAGRFTNLAKSIGNLAPKFVTNVSNVVGGMFTGIRDRIGKLAEAAKKLAAPIVKTVKNAAKPIATLLGKTFKGATKVASKGFAALTTKTPKIPKLPKVPKVTSAGNVAKTAGKTAGKFKGLKKLLKIGKNVPFLGKIITGGLLASILLSGKASRAMVPDIAGLFGGIAATGIGASAGAALGSIIFPGVGTGVGGLLGALIGSFGGDILGTGIAEYMLDLPFSGAFGKGVKGIKSAGKALSGVKSFFGFGKKEDSGDTNVATVTPQDSLVSDVVASSTQISGGGQDTDLSGLDFDEDGTGENQKITINGVQFDKNSPEVKSLRNLPKAKNDGGSSGTMNPNTSTGVQQESSNNVNVSPTTITNNASNTQVVSKNVVEPDVYFQRQSNWAI